MAAKYWLLFFLLLPLVQAQLAIESVMTDPDSVSPGEEIILSLIIENVGNSKISNILVALDLTQLPLAIVDSSTEKIIERISSDDHETVSFRIKTLPTAEPRVYKIPVALAYEGISKTSLLSLEVSVLPKLEAILDTSAIAIIGQQEKITVKFVNTGLIKINFLTVTVLPSPGYQLLSPETAYIGEVNVADFETEEFVLVPKIKDPIIMLGLLYLDANNQEYNTSKLLPLKAYSASEAKRLGLISRSSTGWLATMFIALALLAAYIVRRNRKRSKQKHDQ